MAAVELLNVLRPTVAIARFVTFAALALHEHPECQHKLQASEDDYYDLFVQEIRRFNPFFPFVVAHVRQAFDWQGYHFPKGRKAILDLYDTNHDARLWEQPEAFRPERFHHWDGSPFAFIPQGGGDHYRDHRCAGEWITIELMKVALSFLTRSMTYDVPEQDLRISLSGMPAIPNSRFVISNPTIVGAGKATRRIARRQEITVERDRGVVELEKTKEATISSRVNRRDVRIALLVAGAIGLLLVLGRRLRQGSRRAPK